MAPPAAAARPRRRHLALLVSLLVAVVAPLGLTAWYLWGRAADQYASTVAFSVRAEDQSPAVSLLGGISEFSGAGTRDADILYEYLQSQELVEEMAAELDLAAIWSRPGWDWGDSQADPVFAYDPSGAIEDLLAHWQRKVRIEYDSGTELIEVRVLAFAPQDAQQIAERLLEKSSALINRLSDIAQGDTIRSAQEDLEISRERLRAARVAVTEFRNRNQLVDPETDVASQAGLLAHLQQQLAEALIDADLLAGTTRASDPRVKQTALRIETIEARIAAERSKLGMDGGAAGARLAEVMGQYEELVVDRQFAEESYTSALASFDLAQAEARRKSRYLAAHVAPTRAETSRFPERGLLLGFVGLFLFLTWLILAITVYALKDRR
ncbi:capsule biosynthesis protein [Pseudooceanicola sp. HF7]|uniref:capsule biosynthesis protein n=1 Tax=Pseudooceanicola sp. HF7 TaxID=2721560 RepID=UPI0014318D0B|nr:capsule biosynthesis protein [Pseudooceanicola sp. HF7]NIZ10441.1 capsule biosynthesis protein [Pseudooceanicola sp. HF7]